MSSSDAFAPCRFHDHRDIGGDFSITLSADQGGDAFAAQGHDGGGYAWQALVEDVLRDRDPELLGRVRFDPEADTFCAYGPDQEALRGVAVLIRALLADRAALDAAITHAAEAIRAAD